MENERRAELCFPSITTSASREKQVLYDEYAEKRQELLSWTAEWLRAGTVDELRGTRFEMESRIRLVSWRPEPAPVPQFLMASLPPLPDPAAQLAMLDRSPQLVRAKIQRHNPSVERRRGATAH